MEGAGRELARIRVAANRSLPTSKLKSSTWITRSTRESGPLAAAAIPRGGVIEVTLDGAEETLRISVIAKGTNAKLAGHLPNLLAATPDHPPYGPQDIQAYYTGLVARAANMILTVTAEGDRVSIEAEPR